MIEFSLPIRLVNGANERCHWAKKAKRAKEQRALLFYQTDGHRDFLEGKRGAHFKPPYKVTITRIGKRKMDSDGLAISAKHVRDGIADALEVNDGDESKVTWNYAQEIGKEYAVRVRIEAAR